jgi:Winged helix DNA-binding domain
MTKSSQVLDRRRLNRATMHRQGLAQPWTWSPAEAIRHLVGLQSQLPDPPYLGLWARLDRFRLDDLTRLLHERTVVRSGMMRATLHLVDAEDFLWLRPLLQVVRERAQRGHFGRQTAGLDLADLMAVGYDLLTERPMNNRELRAELSRRWPERDPTALMYSVHYLLPLVQIPPAGTWGSRGSVPCTTDRAWLGRQVRGNGTPDELVLRYLAAHGPASVRDVQLWSGLTRLAEVVQRLRPRLRTFADEHGRELFDLPDAPLPEADTPLPVRYLPDYDNLAMAYADRTRIVDEQHTGRVVNRAIIAATVLVDGFVRATWKISRADGVATLAVDPFTPLRDADRAALEAEGRRLLAFAAADATAHEVRIG